MARTERAEVAQWNAKRNALRESGVMVWCTWSVQPAAAPEGFCEYCGSTTHAAYGEQK
jgi:hypothetical protein